MGITTQHGTCRGVVGGKLSEQSWYRQGDSAQDRFLEWLDEIKVSALDVELVEAGCLMGGPEDITVIYAAPGTVRSSEDDVYEIADIQLSVPYFTFIRDHLEVPIEEIMIPWLAFSQTY